MFCHEMAQSPKNLPITDYSLFLSRPSCEIFFSIRVNPCPSVVSLCSLRFLLPDPNVPHAVVWKFIGDSLSRSCMLVIDTFQEFEEIFSIVSCPVRQDQAGPECRGYWGNPP